MKCAYQYVLQLILGVNGGPHALVEHVDPTSSPMHWQADLGELGLDLELHTAAPIATHAHGGLNPPLACSEFRSSPVNGLHLACRPKPSMVLPH